jgi:hypothetical protein
MGTGESYLPADRGGKKGMDIFQKPKEIDWIGIEQGWDK